ncbi:T9SS type B sorting domain-containing protein, partial [Hymenobacter agri]
VATGFVFTPPANLSGSVTLTYTIGSAACSTTARRIVSVIPAPGLSPFWAPVDCAEARLAPLTLQFTLSSTINYNPPLVQWDFGDGSTSTVPNPQHTYAEPGTYQPRVRLQFGAGQCSALATAPVVKVTERKLPNVITPNGDPLNQQFKIGADCPPRFQVFSRWGQPVFDSPTYHDEWDAAGLPAGNYYYLLTYPNGHRVKGWVEVLR